MRWSALAGLTIVAVVLGHVGFERLPAGDEWSFWDSLHRSVQLFVLESGGVEPPVPWQLEVARFLAPAVTVAAAALALLALFREQARLLAVRLRYRDHSVVAGLGGKGWALARELHGAGIRFVAIERDAAAPAVHACRARGIPVIVGDAADPKVLARAALTRARQLVVVCGEDGTNADVASAARRAAGGATLDAFVHLDDLDLWRHLSGHELAADAGSGVRIDFFNFADAAARVLVESHPPFEPGSEAPHVVVAGVEGIGESVVLHAARAWLAERPDAVSRMRVTICGADAAADRARLIARHPRLEDACDLVPWRLVSGEAPAPPPIDATAPTAAYVCSGPDGVAISAALALRSSGSLGAVPVLVLVRDETEGLATTLRPGGGVIPFGVLNRATSSELVTKGTVEILARAKHAQYVRDERRRGQTPDSNPSMAPWHELGETLRRSNRRFAEGVGAKLREADLVVVPAALADPASAAPVLSDEQVEALAIAEHDRWCADLVADGWRHAPGTKDPERKTHPSLVPWEELSEDERDKDREPVRALPEMLAHVGFELRPAGGGEPARNYAQPALP